MINAIKGVVSINGSAPMIISELALTVKAMRESLAKEYGESATEQLINRAMEVSKAEEDFDERMKGFIQDVCTILEKADSNKDNTEDPASIFEDAFLKELKDMIMHYEDSKMEHYNISEAREAQARYCRENGLPYFAPNDGICYRCNKNIYEKIKR